MFDRRTYWLTLSLFLHRHFFAGIHTYIHYKPHTTIHVCDNCWSYLTVTAHSIYVWYIANPQRNTSLYYIKNHVYGICLRYIMVNFICMHITIPAYTILTEVGVANEAICLEQIYCVYISQTSIMCSWCAQLTNPYNNIIASCCRWWCILFQKAN